MAIKGKQSKQPAAAEMNSLITLFNQGALDDAEPLAVRMTSRYPMHAFGWKALGAIHKSRNRLKDAILSFDVASKLEAKDAEIYRNLANCYLDLDDYANAELNYQKSLKLEPCHVLANYNLAKSLRHQNKFNEAAEFYKKAIEFESNNPLFLVSLADLYYETKEFEAAIPYYKIAINLKPDDAILYVNLGASYKSLLQYTDAKDAYNKALSVNPNCSLAHSNLADMYNEMGRFSDAEHHSRCAINISSGFAKAYGNLAIALQRQNRFDEAATAFRQSLDLDPEDAGVLSNFGILMIYQNQFTQAENYLQQVIVLDPKFAAAYINLALNFVYQGKINKAEACYLKALELEPNNTLAKSGLLFAMNYSSSYSKEERLRHAREYNEIVLSQVKVSYSSWPNIHSGHKLRVGLVSGDFRQHPVAYFLDNVLCHFDQNKIELIAYATDAREDVMTEKLMHYFAAWRSLVGLSDDVAAQHIHADGIQILIDLSGHSAGNRLPIFARKPAPVQISWLGYFSTTGLCSMDYFIADPMGVPSEYCDQFVEKVKYLPDTRLCFSVPDSDVKVSSLPALFNQFITFGSFQNAAKLSDDVLILWSQVLKSIPDAKLRLQIKALGDMEVARTVSERLGKCGIDPKRVSMYGFTSRQVYLEAHAEVDMILDTFPFNGGTTTCEALWMGVPTLTLAGDSLISRQGASLLVSAGLCDWVASDPSDFVNKAISFAHDINCLKELRARLRESVLASPLFDGRLFARNMEKLLAEMWQERGISVVNKENMKSVNSQEQYQQLTKEDYEQHLRGNFKHKVKVVSATRYSEKDFWYKSALGLSLQKQLKQDNRLTAHIAFENVRGLSEVFNENIQLADEDATLVFIHDDVWVDETNLADAVIQGLEHFDVIGVAGNKRRVPHQPAWAFIDSNFTWDERANLSGKVAHGQQAFGKVSDFGDVPAECELMDGVFLAAKKSTLVVKGVQFDPQFDFHFYDLDFCRSARMAGLKLGTWLVRLTHQSGGNFHSDGWKKNCILYLYKWEQAQANAKDEELQQAINDVLQLAVEHHQAGRKEQAGILYQEILEIQPNHAEANHGLGVLESGLKGVEFALPRFEKAIQAQPQQEQFWVSYIDALMLAGAMDTAVSALEIGQQFGLRAETAQKIAAEFVEQYNKNLKLLQLRQMEAQEAMETTLHASHKSVQNNFYKSASPVFYIWAPPYTEQSSGIKALHILCDGLNKLGYEAYIWQKVVNKNLITPELTNDLIEKHKQDGRIQIAVYPEVQMGNPLLIPNVVRYLLNKPNWFLKTSWFGYFHKDDYVLHYSKDFTMPWLQSEELYTPTLNTKVFGYVASNQNFRKGFLVYSNRVVPDLDKIPEWCKPYQVISMKSPKTPLQLAELYRSSEGLISFENTAALPEALLCGCPVIACSDYGFKTNAYLDRVSEISWDFDHAAYLNSKKFAGSYGVMYAEENNEYLKKLEVVADKIINYFRVNESDPLETTPAYAVEIASNYIKKVDIKNAILVYRQLILDQPATTEAYYRLGEILAKIKLFEFGLDVLLQGEPHLEALPKHECLNFVRKEYYKKIVSLCKELGNFQLLNQYSEKERLYS